MRTYVVVAMLTGTAFALVGAFLGVVSRRKEISLTQALLAGSRLAAHPEHFVRTGWVKPIKIINLIGVLAFLSGVLALVALALAGQRLN